MSYETGSNHLGTFSEPPGDSAVLRRCGYSLRGNGIGQATCPECGQKLRGGVRIGHRPVNTRRAAIGLLCLLVAGPPFVGLLYATVAGGDWYRYLPLGWVLRDLRQDDRAAVTRACRELGTRSKTGRLSPADTLAVLVETRRQMQRQAGDFKAVSDLSRLQLILGGQSTQSLTSGAGQPAASAPTPAPATLPTGQSVGWRRPGANVNSALKKR